MQISLFNLIIRLQKTRLTRTRLFNGCKGEGKEGEKESERGDVKKGWKEGKKDRKR